MFMILTDVSECGWVNSDPAAPPSGSLRYRSQCPSHYRYVFISILQTLRALSAIIYYTHSLRLIHSSIVTSHTSTLFDPLRSDWPHEVISELFTAEMIHGFTRQSSRHSESEGDDTTAKWINTAATATRRQLEDKVTQARCRRGDVTSGVNIHPWQIQSPQRTENKGLEKKLTLMVINAI